MLEYKMGQTLKRTAAFRQGTSLKAAGFLVEGSLSRGEGRFLGQQKHSCSRKAGEIFGEVYACRQEKRLKYQYYSSGKSQCFILNLETILENQKVPEDVRTVLLGNLVGILADKTYYMSRKAEF